MVSAGARLQKTTPEPSELSVEGKNGFMVVFSRVFVCFQKTLPKMLWMDKYPLRTRDLNKPDETWDKPPANCRALSIHRSDLPASMVASNLGQGDENPHAHLKKWLRIPFKWKICGLGSVEPLNGKFVGMAQLNP